MQSSKKIFELYKFLLDIAVKEFGTVVESAEILNSQSNEPWKLRLYICDGSFIDVYYSVNNNYSFHWDRKLVDNTIYRHDNAPHKRWKDIPTFPKHFHFRSEENVIPSEISDNPELAMREFLRFVIEEIKKELSSKW